MTQSKQTPYTKRRHQPAIWLFASLFGCAGLYGQSAMALEFPIMLTSETNELQINVDTGQAGQQALVYLDNQESISAFCKVIFTNGPELPIERRITLTPQSKQVVKATLKRSVVKLKIDVTCEAQAAEQPKDSSN